MATRTDDASYHSSVTDHPQLALAVIMAGVLIAAVDTTIVVLALPEIQRALHVALSSVIWVVIGYLLTITLLATQVGKLGDLFGRVRMYEAGFVVFVVGSALCALSWNEAAIIGFRVLQGVGGALVSANSGAVIADIFPPHRRGRAYGFNAVGWSLGAVLGIVLGGVIVTYVSWRWIFWINVPIGIVAVALATRVLHNEATSRHHRFDIGGMLTLGAGIFGLLWAVTQLATRPLDSHIVAFFVGGLVILGVFVLIELRHPEPMVNLRIFRIPTMTPSLLAATFQALGNYAVLFLVIMYLQGPRGLSALDASLLLVPGYLLGGVVGPFAGRLADRVGPVIPATVGLAVQVIALFVYAQLSNDVTLALVVVASIINGIGGSSFFPANNSAVMKAAPKCSASPRACSGRSRTSGWSSPSPSPSFLRHVPSREGSHSRSSSAPPSSADTWQTSSRTVCTPPSTPRWCSSPLPRCCHCRVGGAAEQPIPKSSRRRQRPDTSRLLRASVALALGGPAIVDESTLGEFQCSVGTLGDERIMGSQDDEWTAARSLEKEIEHERTVVGVELAGRLVGDQDRAVDGQCSGDRNTLLLAARQLTDQSVRQPVEPDRGERVSYQRGTIRGAFTAELERQRDVLCDGERSNQSECLRYEDALAAAQSVIAVCIAPEDAPLVGFENACEDVEERGLPRPRRSDDRRELTGCERKFGKLEDGSSPPSHHDRLEDELEGLAHRPSPWSDTWSAGSSKNPSSITRTRRSE